MANFNPDKPYTGTGRSVPKSRSFRDAINLVFRDKSGKEIPQSKGTVPPVKPKKSKGK